MSANPLATVPGSTNGEWAFISIGTASGGETALPAGWYNSEAIYEIYIRATATASNIPLQYMVYNPAAPGTTAKAVYSAWSSAITTDAVVTGATTPNLAIVGAKTTTAHTIFFVKNATSGKLSISQNTNGTAGNRVACDVWIRRVSASVTA